MSLGCPAATIRMSARIELRQVPRFGVANADCCLVLHQHQCHRLADDVARPHDDDILALDRDILVFEQLHDTKGSAGRKHRSAGDEPSHVVEMKSIHVLLDGNRV